MRLWDLEKGTCSRTFRGHKGRINTVAITPDGRLAITGGVDTILRVWDLRAGTCLRILRGHTDIITAVDITPDGQTAISGSEDTSIRIWDVEGGQCLKTYREHTATIISVSLTADGTRAISGTACDDPTIRLWDVESGWCSRTFHEYYGSVMSVYLSPDGKTAASVDRSLRVWDVKGGWCLKILEKNLSSYSSQSVVITPDGRSVIASKNKNICIWDVQTGQLIKTLGKIVEAFYYFYNITLTPDGRLMIGACGNNLHLWDIASGMRLRIINVPECKKYITDNMFTTNNFTKISISPDGCLAISKDAHEIYKVWNIEKGDCLQTLHIPNDSTKEFLNSETNKPLWIELINQSSCVDYIPLQDKRLGVLTNDETLRIVNLETKECLAVIDILSSIFSFDTKLDIIIAGDRFGSIHFMKIFNNARYVPKITTIRLYLFDKKNWDKQLRSICHWCGQYFVVANEILGAIKSINRNARLSPGDSPCLKLPAEAFNDPRLLSACPHCHQPLRFNPFVVDNRDRY